MDIYSFLHITLQKYLAAYYISNHNLLQSALPDLPSEKKKAVMKFYCGIVQSFEGKDDELVALFQDTFQNKESCLHRAHCAFESQQSSVCNHIIELGKGSLDISAVHLSLTDVIAIAFLISAASLPINSLKISSCGLAETELNVFLKSIKSTDFKSLQELDIHSNCFGPSGAIFLAENLLDSHDLVCLNLSNNRIGSVGAVAVAKVLTINKNLQAVSLACNKIHHGGAVALANALENCSKLQYLDLSSNCIGNEGAKGVGSSLKYCKNLEHLMLVDNHIESKGVTALAEGLKNSACLQSIDLNQNKIGSVGAIALASVIRDYNPNLKYIFLRNNNIGSCGAAALADSLVYCKNLKTLSLDQNCISSDGAAALTATIVNCDELKFMSLSHNKIGLDGAKALFAVLQCSSLLTLELDGNPIGPDSVSVLRSSTHDSTVYIDILSEVTSNEARGL